jgi:hypothetical protein
MSRQETVAVLSLMIVACLVSCAPRATPLPTPQSTATPTRRAGTYTAKPVPLTATPLPTPTEAWKTYANASYRITLRYPSSWQFVSGYGIKYAGPDGFFQLSAISGPSASIDQIADGEAYHKLLPYGSQPTIEALEIDGQPSRLILPSADQPTAMAGQSGLIVQLPQPIDISVDTYNYLVLWADERHIRQIAETVTLQKPTNQATATLDPATAPAVVQNVLLVLYRQFRASADQLQFLGYKYVNWPDGCLGIPMRAVCTQAIVPGYRILVRFENQDYEYRTDLQGSRFLLASAPAHRITSPVLIWEGGEVCDTLLLNEDGRAAIGPCDAPLCPLPLSGGLRRSGQWSALVARFAAFEAATPSGHIVFQGSGQESPRAGWQRAIAAWAELVHKELQSGLSIASWSTALTWQEEIDSRPGYCRSLRVDSFGYALASETLCEGGFTQILAEGWLTTQELESFDTWYYGNAALESAELSFGGLGPNPMSKSGIEQVKAWAGTVYTRLAQSDAHLHWARQTDLAGAMPKAGPCCQSTTL